MTAGGGHDLEAVQASVPLCLDTEKTCDHDKTPPDQNQQAGRFTSAGMLTYATIILP